MKPAVFQGPFSRNLLAVVIMNSLFLIANGLFMLIDPKEWFLLIPGVKFTGGFNQHFIRDIGLIQLLLGVAFIVGITRSAVRFELWSAATLWLSAHSLFHFWEVAVGICGPSTILHDFPGVTLPALIGIVATVWAYRNRTRRGMASVADQALFESHLTYENKNVGSHKH